MFNELSVINGLVVRGHQLIIPIAMQANVVALSHEGHQATDKTLNLLRQFCWFPRMGKAVAEYVGSCLGCNAATDQSHPVPLEPNLLPERAWQHVHADFKGPIGGDYYLHVIIDQYSKFPEVDVLKSTSFKKLKPILNRVFATHGIPEEMTSDNGPPYDSHDMEMYAAEMGFKLTPVAPCDPQGNGFVENFVKGLCKMVHTSVVEGKDPKDQLYTYLLHYRATPHITTGFSPAEMLFNRKLQTKLPQIHVNSESKERRKIRVDHNKKKLDQKEHFDKRHRATKKEVAIGDKALVKQKKSTIKPPYDPNPYKVDGLDGNRVKLTRGDGATRVRDKNQLKILKKRPNSLVPSWEGNCTTIPDCNSFDIEFDLNEQRALPTTERFPVLSDIVEESEEGENEASAHADDGDALLFDLDEDAETRMRNLLTAAAADATKEMNRDNAPVTRSKGLKLTWNPCMSDKNVVLEEDSD